MGHTKRVIYGPYTVVTLTATAVYEYFNGIFPYATGIIFDDNDRNELVGIARDENGNFIFDWNTDVVYKLVFYDMSSNRSNRSNRSNHSNRSNQNSSITSKIWNWLMLGGSLLRSTSSTSPYKKTI
ncbi:unnamed protein product [Rotaria socialis]|uniref:Uncharacterized protein n=1 Tax=Rotaria socialis TaxID=392032 RepID=A0A817KZ24_9BILA|nr:unnamed protein product [Rotaria socialis]